MGTFVRISAYAPPSQKSVLEKGLQLISRLDATFSAHREDSEISRINAAAGKKAVRISQQTERLLQRALFWAQKSDAAFEPTIGPIVSLWGIGSATPTVPDALKIKKALEHVSYHGLSLSEGKAFLKNEGQALDLGGIAKGFAADRVAELLQQEGIRSALIDLGGNVVAVGERPDGHAWRIGIQDPTQPRGQAIASVAVKELSVVTSGVYERYFEQGGKRYHHLFSSETGFPAESGLLSVTVLSKSSADGDALSTALFVMGKRQGIAFLKTLPDIQAIFVEKSGDTLVLTLPHSLEKSFDLLEKKHTVDFFPESLP